MRRRRQGREGRSKGGRGRGTDLGGGGGLSVQMGHPVFVYQSMPGPLAPACLVAFHRGTTGSDRI